MESVKNLLYESLKAKYEYEIKDATARLAVYFNNAVGIGEHPQITEEMDKLIEMYTNANDKLHSLSIIKEKVM